jgi:arylsulfatase A
VASPPDLVAGYRDVTPTEEEAQYFANVENMDRAVGDLLGALDRLGVGTHTLVMFTSDNGPETLGRYRGAERSYGRPGPWRGMKLWTTEAGCRVPGILRWPARLAAGQVRDEPVSSLDVLPTFAALAGGTVPRDRKLDGTDLGPWLAGGEFKRQQPLFWVYFNAINEQRVSMREGPWKVMARLDGGALPKWSNITATQVEQVRGARLTDFSLYHLVEDPGETEDRAGDRPERVAEMGARLEGLYREVVGSMQVWQVSER